MHYTYDSHSLILYASVEDRAWLSYGLETGTLQTALESGVFNAAALTEIDDVERCQLGALTSAPIVALEEDWQADIEHAHVFWFANYQVESLVETLAKTGKVVLQAA